MRLNKKYTFIFIIFVCTFSILFIFFLKEKKNMKNGTNDYLEIKFESNDILKINNKLPLSDVLGKSIKYEDSLNGNVGFLEFSIINKSAKTRKYNITINKRNVDSKMISDNYIKIYLTDINDNPLKGFSDNKITTYNELSYSKNNVENVVLYSDFAEKLSKNDYRLRVWVSDSYGLSKLEESIILDIGIEGV